MLTHSQQYAYGMATASISSPAAGMFPLQDCTNAIIQAHNRQLGAPPQKAEELKLQRMVRQHNPYNICVFGPEYMKRYHLRLTSLGSPDVEESITPATSPTTATPPFTSLRVDAPPFDPRQISCAPAVSPVVGHVYRSGPAVSPYGSYAGGSDIPAATLPPAQTPQKTHDDHLKGVTSTPDVVESITPCRSTPAARSSEKSDSPGPVSSTASAAPRKWTTTTVGTLTKRYIGGRPVAVVVEPPIAYAEVVVRFPRSEHVFAVRDVAAVFGAVREKDLVGRHVIVEGDRGVDLGVVNEVTRCETTAPGAPSDSAKSESRGGLPLVLREATADDVASLAQLERTEAEALAFCREQAARLLGNEEVLTVEYAVFQFDMQKLTFGYRSEAYVEFVPLLRALNRAYRCRIWMNQLQPAAADRSAPLSRRNGGRYFGARRRSAGSARDTPTAATAPEKTGSTKPTA